MFAPMIAKATATSGRLKASVPQRSTPGRRHGSDAAGHASVPRSYEQQSGLAGREAGPAWDFSTIPLFPPDRADRGRSPCTTLHDVQADRAADALAQRTYGLHVQSDVAVDEDVPLLEEKTDSLEPCGDCTSAACAGKNDLRAKGSAPSVSAADAVVAGDPVGSAPAQDAYTYTFISRGSYGQTTPGFTRPSCVAGAPGTSTLAAGTAVPTVTVFPTGTYQVRRNDGVVQTATCTRSAAGLAATQTHENSHAAGARAGVAAANTAQGLPKNFATPAECAAALPAVLTAWNTSVNAAWANEVAHGPGTNPPTAATFTEENAAGTCTFS
jgi:hypothetical protein